MNIPKEAIEKAIEGGWGVGSMPAYMTATDMYQFLLEFPERKAQVVLDSIFWYSLGKALGWPYISAYPRESDNEHETWRVTAHDFLDLILTGQPTDTFWASLLSPSNSTRV